MVLTIGVPGGAAAGLEVFCQDIAAGGSFSPAGPWRLAAEGMSCAPGQAVMWRDDEFIQPDPASRPELPAMRIYLVSRQDVDTDGDGLGDAREILLYKTDAASADSDQDGMPDAWEVTNGLDPTRADANDDLDGDGRSNIEEYRAGTRPDSAALPPAISLLAPARDLVTRQDSIEVLVAIQDGAAGMTQPLAPGPADPNLDARVTEVAVVENVDLHLDGRLVQTRPKDRNSPAVQCSVNIKDLPDGPHTLSAAARLEGEPAATTGGDASVPSVTRSITIDRRPPEPIDASRIVIEGGTLGEDGVIATRQREIALTCRVADDVVLGVFESAPHSVIAPPRDTPVGGNLALSVRGLRMGDTRLSLRVLDQAGNQALTLLTVRRLAPENQVEGGRQ